MKTPFCILALLCVQGAYAQRQYYPYSDGHHWGLTNEKAEALGAPQFDTSFRFTDPGYAVVRKDGKYGTIDSSGQTRVACSYDKLEPINDETGDGLRDGRHLLLNFRSGKQLSPTAYDKLVDYCQCQQKLIIAAIGKKYVFVNTVSGQQLGKTAFDEAVFVQGRLGMNGRAIVKINGKAGVINTQTGAWVIPARYEKIDQSSVNDKDAFALINGAQKTYADADGKTVIEQKKAEQLDGVMEETMGVVEAPARDDNDGNRDLYVYSQGGDAWKVTIESRGYGSTKILQTTELKGYTSLKKLSYRPWGSNLAASVNSIQLLAVKDGHAGVIDLSGKVLVPFIYDKIERDSRNDCIRTSLDGKTGVLGDGLAVLKQPVLKRLISQDYRYHAWLVEMPGGQMGYMNMRSGKIYIPGIAD